MPFVCLFLLALLWATWPAGAGARGVNPDDTAVSRTVPFDAYKSLTAQGATLKAGTDLTVTGSALNARDDIQLLAAGTTTLASALESVETHSVYHKSGRHQESSSASLTHQATTVTAGGDLLVNVDNSAAGVQQAAEAGDVNSLGARISTGGESYLYGDTINLLAVKDLQQSSYVSSKKRWYGGSSRSAGQRLLETLKGSELIAGEDVGLLARQDIRIVGGELGGDNVQQDAVASLVHSGGDLSLSAGVELPATAAGHLETVAPAAGQNLIVDTLALTNERWDERRRGLSGPLKEVVKIGAMYTEMYMPWLNAEVKLGEREISRTHDETQAGSGLYADSLQLSARDRVQLIGTDVGVNGRLTIAGRDVVIDAAQETHSQVQEAGSDTVKGLGLKLDSDELRVAGVQTIKTSSQDRQHAVTWRGTTINAEQLVIQAEQDIAVLGSQLTISGDADIRAGHELTIGGREGELTHEHKDTTETITVAAAVRNAYVDAVLAIQAIDAAKDALKAAKRALEEAERKANHGQLDADDLDYFRANVAVAAANLSQATIAAAGAVATAAATTGTGGFYASASADRDKTVTTTTSTQSQWQGSTLNVGGNASLRASEHLTVRGSDVAVADTLHLDAQQVDLLAGSERRSETSKTKQEHQGASVSFNPAGVTGGSVNAGFHQSDATSQATHHVNSQLTAGTVISQSEQLRLAGAVVEADQVQVETGKLLVVSLQDESRNQAKSQGLQAGVGIGGSGNVSSVSAGVDFQRSDSERRWVAEQSGIIGHDRISVRAQDTVLTGGLIAHARRDEQGQLIDQGGLEFQTGTLTVNDLHDIDTSKTVGASLGVSRSLTPTPAGPAHGNASNAPAQGGPSDANKQPVPHGTTTLGATYLGHVTEQTTHATIGQGQIVIGGQTLTDTNAAALGLAELNRDLSQAQEITKNEDIGGLNATLTVDNRWFSPEGRADIAKDVANVGGNFQRVAQGLERDIQRITVDIVPEQVAKSLKEADKWSFGLLPFDSADNGGLLAQVPIMAGARDVAGGTRQLRAADDPQVLANPELYMPAEQLPGYTDLAPEGQAQLKGQMVTKDFGAITPENATYRNHTNGMMNTPAEAMVNAIEQTGSGGEALSQNYNARHGFLMDILEIGTDKLGILVTNGLKPVSKVLGVNLTFMTGAAEQTGEFMHDVMAARGMGGANFSNHSQANILTLAGLNGLNPADYAVFLDKDGKSVFTFESYGSPVPNQTMFTALDSTNLTYLSSTSNAGDFVSEVLGGNRGAWRLDRDGTDFSAFTLSTAERWQRVGNATLLLTGDKYPILDPVTQQPTNTISPHSGYSCAVNCTPRP